ncbi:unnamed protein product [Adineta ricciae]|uniref:Uncharacterized protein n=1 Tax=Adineta ricciae TaxID=249248 RepID=A0A815VBW1_ADIRI|nr:unnamed protein product [Adineta ricciae]CAF1532776.1 unnamed protein product [Adineta ricciae]
MNSTILYKGNKKRTTATQQIFLMNGTLYLYVDTVMKMKTSKKKKKRAISNTDDMEPSVGDPSEDEAKEINASTGGTTKRSIAWRGGSKNGGIYEYYNKINEAKECVNSILSYGRDHGTLLSGVQLKTIMDIQNVEITKERANDLVQLVSSCIDIVPNPHFVSPTSKRSVYEYYGPGPLVAVEPTRSIPIPSEILVPYKREPGNKTEPRTADDDRQTTGDTQDHQTTQEAIDLSNNDVDIQNNPMITSTVLHEEVVINENLSLSPIYSNEDSRSFIPQSKNKNIDLMAKHGETSNINSILAISPPDTENHSNVLHTNSRASSLETDSSCVEISNGLNSFVQNSKQTTVESLSASASTFEDLSGNQTSTNNTSGLNSCQPVNSTQSSVEIAPSEEQQRISRRSIALRSKTKLKQKQQAAMVPATLDENNENAYATSSGTSTSKRKLRVVKESTVASSTLSKASKKKPKHKKS